MRLEVFTVHTCGLAILMTAGCVDRTNIKDGFEGAAEDSGTVDGEADETGGTDDAGGPDDADRGDDPGEDEGDDDGVIEECTDHYFAVSGDNPEGKFRALALFESSDGANWSMVMQGPELGLGQDLVATRGRAFITGGATAWAWSRESAMWTTSTLDFNPSSIEKLGNSALVAATDTDELFMLDDTQKDQVWTPVETPFASALGCELLGGLEVVCLYSDVADGLAKTSAFDGASWSSSQPIPWRANSFDGLLESPNSFNVTEVADDFTTQVWRSFDGTSWTSAGPLELPAGFGDQGDAGFLSAWGQMIDDDLFAWAGFQMGSDVLTLPLRLVVFTTSDFESWTTIPLGPDLAGGECAFTFCDLTEVVQMSDGRLLVGGGLPSGGNIWIVDPQEETAMQVASELDVVVQSLAVSRCD